MAVRVFYSLGIFWQVVVVQWIKELDPHLR